MRYDRRTVLRSVVGGAAALLATAAGRRKGLAQPDRDDALADAALGKAECMNGGGESYTVFDGGEDGSVLGMCVWKDGTSCVKDYTNPSEPMSCISPAAHGGGGRVESVGATRHVLVSTDPTPPAMRPVSRARTVGRAAAVEPEEDR